jgi:hypothetical protein
MLRTALRSVALQAARSRIRHVVAGDHSDLFDLLDNIGPAAAPETLRDWNGRLGARAYVPGLGPVTAFQGHGSWLRQFGRLLLRGLRVPLAMLGTKAPAKPHWTQEEKQLTSIGDQAGREQ